MTATMRPRSRCLVDPGSLWNNWKARMTSLNSASNSMTHEQRLAAKENKPQVSEYNMVLKV